MPSPRTIAVLTTGRQDYGILRSTILALRSDARFRSLIWVGGMHLHPRFGATVAMIRDDGIEVHRELDFLRHPSDPLACAAEATLAVGRALEADRPDCLMLVGDRTETLAAGVAATLARVPIVHLHGGEESEGAIDNACRHALTKLSHLHLVSHPAHARRVLQMGEPDASVVVVGAPGLDNLFRSDLPGREEIARDLGRPLEDPLVLVTLHPTTLAGDPVRELRAVTGALAEVRATYLVTLPNSDAGGSSIADGWQAWAAGRDNVVLSPALGERRYWALLRHAAAVLGNSSSGIIEAPAAGVPVVNVGDRQKGRLRWGPVIDVEPESAAIVRALRSVLEGRGARPAPGATDPSRPAVPAAPRILEALATWVPPEPPRKAFRDRAWTKD